VLPLARISFACPVSLGCCGLRGLKGNYFPPKRTEGSVSFGSSSDRNFLIPEMSKSVQDSSFPAWVPAVPFGRKRMDQEGDKNRDRQIASEQAGR
jgi:hypothetical protein